MKTLVFHDGALGDVLLSLPCITAIGRHATALDIVCRADVGRLFLSAGVVHGAFSADSSEFLPWYSGRPDHAAREMLGLYARVYVFTRVEETGLATNIAGIIPDTRIIATVPPAGERTHVAAFRLRQLPDTARNGATDRLSLPPAIRNRAREAIARAGRGEKDLIVLHPGSGGKGKCWPLERYLALAEQLAPETGAFLLFLSGPAEAPPVKELIDRFVRDRNAMAHIADADIVRVAGFLAESGLYIGNDSGISHLAAAVGARIIALFGPTDPALWRPCGETVQVVAASAMEDIAVDAVLAAVRKDHSLQGTFL